MSDLLDALSYIGGALDKPGRAVRGFMAGRPDELAAAIPFSDSLGFTDPGRATSGKDLLNALGMDVGSGLGGDVAGFATEVATDPLSWLGAGAGARLGSAAEKAAVAAGPRYGTTADDLSRMLQGSLTGDMVESQILASPHSKRLLSEINPDSQLIGNGVEALAFKEPNGTVTRLGQAPIGWENTGRPQIPGVAQAESTMNLPTGFRVERGIPMAENVGDMGYWTKRPNPSLYEMATRDAVPGWPIPESILRTRSEHLDRTLADRGFNRIDRHFGNVGTVDRNPGFAVGGDVVIDPGDLAPTMGRSLDSMRATTAFAPVAQSAEPGMLMSKLLEALGSGPTIQAGLNPRYQAMLGLAGGGGGATTGAFGRAFGQ